MSAELALNSLLSTCPEEQMATNLSDFDLQALQQAVGKANNAYTSIPDSPENKKKRKRKEKHAAGGTDVVELEEHGKDKQKKRQKSSGNDTEAAEAVPAAEAPDTIAIPTDQPKKKKSKKRDKGKQPEIHTESFPVYSQQQQQPISNSFDVHGSPSSNAPTSTAAFLTALVTAASESQNQTHGHHPPVQYHPHSQSQFMQYQSMGYPYHPGPPGHYPAPPFHHEQPSLLPIGGVPLNDLALASNEDILRALQDLDMTKIASVLKTLGEAAASHLHAGPFGSHIPGPPPPNQVPTTAGDILNTNAVESKQQEKDQGSTQGRPGHNRVLNMSLSGPELHMNTDHAYMLAHKWMNPSKLTELVKTEGKSILVHSAFVAIEWAIGLVYKKGKFSAIEEKQLHDAIENYRAVSLPLVLFLSNNSNGSSDNGIDPRTTYRPYIRQERQEG